MTGTYRWLLVGAAASLLGVGMLLLNQIAGPVTIADSPSGGEISSDQGEYAMVALALIVVGAASALATRLALRGDPDPPLWADVLSGVMIVVAAIVVLLFVVGITFIVLLCRDGCN
jgi:hypothetical protein